MAAGRVSVPRRRENYASGYLEKEEKIVPYKNGTRDSKLSRVHLGHQNTNGCGFSSDWQDLGPRRGAPGVKNSEVSKHEDGVQLPPEKKRKFSPIIWDSQEKEVRMSSKNRVVPIRSFSCIKSPEGSVREASTVVSDGGAAKKSIKENLSEGLEYDSEKPFVVCGLVGTTVSKSTVGLYALLPQEETGVDDLDLVHLEEEELVQLHSILASRWASDSDSPRDVFPSNGDDTAERGQSSKSSTPESGEFRRESLEDRASPRLSGCDELCLGRSSKDEYSESELEDDVMDVDKSADEDSAGKQLQMEEVAVTARRSMNMFPSCRSVFEFEKLNKINEGTYGIVYRARDKATGEIVALKKVKMDVGRKQDLSEYGFPISSLREINILLSFNHPSIVNVKEVVVDDFDNVFMVMEFMEHDLKGLIETMKQPFSTSEVKCLMLQLLEGVKYLHDNWLLHRDLKTSNLLVNNQGVLKVCDFGMSRQYGSPLKPYTSLVVTLWYRAPELLLGMKKYSTAVDMWSVGCIMAELLAKKPLFNGKTEADQIDKIFKTLGTPTEPIWPGFSELPGAKAHYVKQPYNLLRKRFPATSFTGSPVLSELGFDLLNKLLSYDPEKRLTADAALNHDWFREVPLPKSKEFMPTFPQHAARNRPLMKGKESGRRETSIDRQHRHMLYMPCHKEAVIWHGCEPAHVQA